MALTGDIVVDDGAVLSLEGDAADLAALQDDPQSIVLNGGVLISLISPPGRVAHHTTMALKSAAAAERLSAVRMW
ncbi:hypothetical protein ACLB1M_17975 [Escherichia coli]